MAFAFITSVNDSAAPAISKSAQAIQCHGSEGRVSRVIPASLAVETKTDGIEPIINPIMARYVPLWHFFSKNYITTDIPIKHTIIPPPADMRTKRAEPTFRPLSRFCVITDKSGL